MLAVFVETAKVSWAVNLDNSRESSPSSETDSIISDISKKNAKISLTIRIVVPQNKGAVDTCRVYPYPVAPPFRKTELDKLPLTDKELRSLALSMTYWSKSHKNKPYPVGGWRLQHIMDMAMKKSGLGPPHSIFTEYAWADGIIPYMRKEILAVNAEETERKRRYYEAQNVFNEYKADLEVQSFNKGLFPIDVPIKREVGGYHRGQVYVDKSNWWIVALHKVSGLKLYWLWPVKLNDNPEQTVTLTEENAIYIEGAW